MALEIAMLNQCFGAPIYVKLYFELCMVFSGELEKQRNWRNSIGAFKVKVSVIGGLLFYSGIGMKRTPDNIFIILSFQP